MNDSTNRPLAVATGASSGIGVAGSLKNRLQTAAATAMPAPASAALHGAMAKPGSGDE